MPLGVFLVLLIQLKYISVVLSPKSEFTFIFIITEGSQQDAFFQSQSIDMHCSYFSTKTRNKKNIYLDIPFI